MRMTDQPCLPAGEIGSVWPDRELTREIGPQAPNHAPEFSLMPGRIVAERSRALRVIEGYAAVHYLERNGFERFAHPPLAPPFQGGDSTAWRPSLSAVRWRFGRGRRRR